MRISICIPTYNRASLLENCLNSIIQGNQFSENDFEICISDNCSTDNTQEIVQSAQKKISINYSRGSSNIGMARNFLKVVDMAIGEFVWIIGDDDLLLPGALIKLKKLINEHSEVDFFYINSYHLSTEYLKAYPHPFSTTDLPSGMLPFSSYEKNGIMRFIDLVDPSISFDFLGGIFLNVFRREKWVDNIGVLDLEALKDERTFASFDSTFPHLKIFAAGFANSKAYFNSAPLTVCLTGAREWAPIYPYVRSIRLVEALDEYRNNGLGLIKYLKCKNYALQHFLPDMISMLVRKGRTGREFIQMRKYIFRNSIYPNFYLSFFYYLFRKSKQILLNYKIYIQQRAAIKNEDE
jgi:glycosyltransferase involved in cell wall biosynthesis